MQNKKKVGSGKVYYKPRNWVIHARILNRAPVSQCNNHAKESRWTLDTYLPKSDCLPPEGM